MPPIEILRYSQSLHHLSCEYLIFLLGVGVGVGSVVTHFAQRERSMIDSGQGGKGLTVLLSRLEQ